MDQIRQANAAHPARHETKRWRDLYRGRAAVEREFGRLKMDYGLTPIRVRGIDWFRFTLTSACWPAESGRSPEREPYRSPRKQVSQQRD